MMHPPRFWWLLAPVVLLQAAGFAWLLAGRLRGWKEPAAGPAAIFLGGAVGLVYAVMQRDAVLFLGQACVMVLVVLRLIGRAED